MKTRFNLFAQQLYGPTHSEVVLLSSIQVNHYSKVQDKYEWMTVISVKILLWEIGFAITKMEQERRKKILTFKNEELINYSEEPYGGQVTSVPEKQIGDE